MYNVRTNVSIDIVYSGLRPGEKLYEELFVEGEEYTPTQHEKVFILHNCTKATAQPVDFERAVAELIEMARSGDDSQIRAKLQEIVPEYAPVL